MLVFGAQIGAETQTIGYGAILCCQVIACDTDWAKEIQV
jgi:hypothetical protein